MSVSMNRVCLSGNLSKNPELRQTKAGLPILSIVLATDDRRQNEQTGKWEKGTNYITCTLFGSRATHVAALLHKGSKVAIEGKLRNSQWKAKDGSSRCKLEVIINSVEFLNRFEKE